MGILSTRARCRQCDYALRALPEPRCPECGTPFDPANPDTYRVKRRFHWRGVAVVLVITSPLWIVLAAWGIAWLLLG